MSWSLVAPSVRTVLPVRVDPSGREGPTRGQARGPGWRRSSTGLYVPVDADANLVEQRIVEQGARLQRGAITGGAALRLLGGGYFDGLADDGRTRLRVEVAANGDRLGSDEHLDAHRVEIAEGDVVIRHGVRCAKAERAVFDAVRWAETLEQRVQVIDMAVAAELTSIRRVKVYTLGLRHVHDRHLVLVALSWANEHAESPQEVLLRLIWRRLFNLREPLVNRTVVDDSGRRLGRPDLVDEQLGMGAEFDGAEHRTRGRHQRDVRRLDDFQNAGLEIATFVGAYLRDERLVVDRLRAARARAGRLPRHWRLAPAGPSLDERLDRRDVMMAMAEASRRDL
jgi:hypothetical protein